MRRLTMLGVLTVTGFALAAPGATDPPKKPSRLVGEWRYVSIDGQETVPTTDTYMADGTVVTRSEIGLARSSAVSRYVTNETAYPARIDTRFDDDPPLEGIFKIEGDHLTICSRKGRGQRPKAFGEKGATTDVLERVKPKD
jgi:uncharacterized protein (TIGR03067 family)